MNKKILAALVTTIMYGCGSSPNDATDVRCSYKDREIVLEHEAYVFKDGSVMTTCSATTDSGRASNFEMYKSSQPGAKDDYCLLEYPSGKIEFRRYMSDGLRGYQDVSLATNPDVFGSVQLPCVQL